METDKGVTGTSRGTSRRQWSGWLKTNSSDENADDLVGGKNGTYDWVQGWLSQG